MSSLRPLTSGPLSTGWRNRLQQFAAAALILPAIVLFPLGHALAADQPLSTVESVDLARYAGTWYEIARLPNRFQKQCVSDTQAEYRLDTDSVQVINRCRIAEGAIDEIKGRAKVVAGSGNAKLRVTFFWPFYGDYWILALNDDYGDVLVGSPDRQFAWILARRPQLPQARLNDLLQRAQWLGFDSTAFVSTPQGDPLPTAAKAAPTLPGSTASAPERVGTDAK